MHKSTMKTCDHVSSRDIKKQQVGSSFVMRAGLRNNELCLCGLIQFNDSGRSMIFKKGGGGGHKIMDACCL